MIACLSVPLGLGKPRSPRSSPPNLPAECHEVLSQAIQSAADLNAVLLAAKEKDVVFLDESHELPKEQQTALYLAIDQRKIVLVWIGQDADEHPDCEFHVALGNDRRIFACSSLSEIA